MPGSRRQATRERLTRVAADLFYRRGIQATGIDRIVSEAGLTKPTFYNHFPSKSDLIVSVLDLRSKSWQEALTARIARFSKDPRRQLLAIFDFLQDFLAEPGFRGCALVNGAVELPTASDPGKAVARRNKQWNRRLAEDLARNARMRDSKGLAAGLVLLMEGAISSAYVEGNGSAGKQARMAAKKLIQAHQTGASRQ